MPLPGRNGFADRVCDNCDNSCHKASEMVRPRDASGRRLGRDVHLWVHTPLLRAGRDAEP